MLTFYLRLFLIVIFIIGTDNNIMYTVYIQSGSHNDTVVLIVFYTGQLVVIADNHPVDTFRRGAYPQYDTVFCFRTVILIVGSRSLFRTIHRQVMHTAFRRMYAERYRRSQYQNGRKCRFYIYNVSALRFAARISNLRHNNIHIFCTTPHRFKYPVHENLLPIRQIY